MSDKVTRLTDFPYSNPGYGRRVAVVGVGSAGCRIASQLSKESKLLEHFVYLSCDEHDVASTTKGEKIVLDGTVNCKSSPYTVRGIATSKLPQIRRAISDSEVVFVISGLGGTVGSGLAPLVAQEAKSKGAVTIAIVVMPYNFEKGKHYFAGGALRQLKRSTSGLVVIDNDELIQSRTPLIDAYSIVNQRIALALNKLFGSAEQHEFSVGLSNIVNFLKTNSYSVLCLGDSELSEYKQAVLNAVNHFERTVDTREASKSIVHLCTDKSITPTELVNSIGGLSGLMGAGTMQVEYGLSANSTTCTTAIIMATGFSATKYDRYDPVDYALGKKSFNLDDDLESTSFFQSLLPDVEAD
ncbi:MAG: hypothetical protein M1368_01090 [Thaumarchaeota archaeon]|nr:hypothetical protein [Nitrososphaerota archaeon]MDG6906588.1 hypothetical protein [Nitrososphaerota archaeon]